MKFFALVALVGYTQAIKLSGFPVVEPKCPTVIPAANMTSCPGQLHGATVSADTSGTPGIITDNGAVANIALAQGTPFPAVEPACPTLNPAANMTSCPGQLHAANVSAATAGTAGIGTDTGAVANIALAQGPNGTVHDERRFDPPATPPTPAAPAGARLAQIPANILEPGCIGGLAAAANSTTCPNNRAHVETAAATHGEAGIMTDKGAVANIALAQGPNGTVHVDGTFDPAVVAAPAAPAGPAPVPNVHPGHVLTPYVVPVALAQIQGPNGTIHMDGTFDPPATPPTPAAPAGAK
jgi:hypothetical protein